MQERAEGWYDRVKKPYIQADVAPVNLGNSGRLEKLLRAGRLYLSLQDVIALALENNLDVELQRYSPRIAETDLLRAQSGAAIRGTAAGVSSRLGVCPSVCYSGRHSGRHSTGRS